MYFELQCLFSLKDVETFNATFVTYQAIGSEQCQLLSKHFSSPLVHTDRIPLDT